jgi:hypothetical protein
LSESKDKQNAARQNVRIFRSLAEEARIMAAMPQLLRPRIKQTMKKTLGTSKR